MYWTQFVQPQYLVRRRWISAALLAALAALAACGTPGPNDAATSQYKIGRPYKIAGVWYRPAEDFGYDATGIASWYGRGFHGRSTANGEIYDMKAMTAAHRTLPMPSLVRVTNLENGRQVVVRINDRGPFARGRIIDMSRQAARLLRFERRGTARVRVQVLTEQSMALKMRAISGPDGDSRVTHVAAAPRQSVELVETLRPAFPPPPVATSIPAPPAPPVVAAFAEPKPRPAGAVTIVPVAPTEIFVQAGAFAESANAARLRQRLSAIGPARVQEITVGTQRFYRVRMGPVDSVEAGDRLLATVVEAGVPEARLVVD